MDNIYVADVIDSRTIVINKGSSDGITKEDKFIIYELKDEILDPVTNEKLGRLKLKKGTAVVDDIQDRITVIKSDQFISISKKEKPEYGMYSLFKTTTEYTERERAPFEREVLKGDSVVIYNRK